MKTLMLGSIAAVAAAATPVASADYERHDDMEYARVLSATPVYRSVRVQRPCPDERVRHRGRGSYVRDDGGPGPGLQRVHAGTPSDGALPIAYESDCAVLHESPYEERLEGYDVAYRYHGRVYHTRMPYDPGDRIAVRVDVRPVRY